MISRWCFQSFNFFWMFTLTCGGKWSNLTSIFFTWVETTNKINYKQCPQVWCLSWHFIHVLLDKRIWIQRISNHMVLIVGFSLLTFIILTFSHQKMFGIFLRDCPVWPHLSYDRQFRLTVSNMNASWYRRYFHKPSNIIKSWNGPLPPSTTRFHWVVAIYNKWSSLRTCVNPESLVGAHTFFFPKRHISHYNRNRFLHYQGHDPKRRSFT